MKGQLCVSMTVLAVVSTSQYLVYYAKSYLITLARLKEKNCLYLFFTELKYLNVQNMEAVFMVHKLVRPSLILSNSSCLFHKYFIIEIILNWILNSYLLTALGCKGHISASRVQAEHHPTASGHWRTDSLSSQESITAGHLIKRMNWIKNYE